MRTSPIAPFAVSAALAALAAWTAPARDCGMAFVDTSVPTQPVAACSCEDFFTVDFSVAVTCCECYSGPFAFSGVYRRGTDGSIPSFVSTNFVAACDCDGCTAEHRVSCSVKLVSDPFCGTEPSPPGAIGGGDSSGGYDPLPSLSNGGSPPRRLTRRAAQRSAFAVPRGAPTVAVSLGRGRSGGFTGHLELDPAKVFSHAVATPAVLDLAGGVSTGLDPVLSPSNDLLQVRSAECLADISVPPASNSFSVAFYRSSDLGPELGLDGRYDILSNAVPYVVYEVGPFADDGGRRLLPVTERRGGEVVSSRALYASRSAADAGVSFGGGLVERGVRELPDGALLRYVRGAGAPERGVADYYTAVGGEQVLAMRVEASSSGEARTSRWEYAEGPYPAAYVDPSGLRTEYAYDGAGRVVRETVRTPGRPVRVRTMSYNPIGVRPHAPAGVASIADDDCTEYVGLPRDETESVGGVAVSRTLRFASIDVRNHRIVEEVRLLRPTAADAADAWSDPANSRTYSDYMPKNSCRSCSERLSLGVAAEGTVDERDYVSGTYEPGQGGSAGVFTPDPENKKYFRTVATRRPAGALSSGSAQVPGRTVREVTVEARSSRLVVLKETYVCTGPGDDDFERIAWTATTRDDLGNPVLEVSSDSSRIEREYAGERLLAETAADGSRTTYSYDALGRVVSETKSWNGQRPSTTTSYVRDMEGRVLSRTVASGNLSETETTEYDAFGRTTLAVAVDGVVTKHLYNTDAVSGLETRTAIRGFGTPCAVTNETVSYADGRTKETRLNGVLRRTYSYGTDADGCEWTKTSEGRFGADSPRWRTAKTNPLGRTVEETTSGFGAAIVSSNRYDAAGRLVATTIYAAPTQPIRSAIYRYDTLGERTLAVEDLDLDGVVDMEGPDRVVSNSIHYVKLDGDWWRESAAWQARNDGSAALSRTSCVRERMTGLGGADGLVSETVSIDIRGNETHALACRDRAAMAETRIVSVPGSEIPETSVTVCGLVATNVTSTDVTTTYGYDALGRETSATDGRGNTTTTAYDAQGRVVSTTDGAGNATTYGYDAIGRRVSATDPMGNTVATAYDAEGRVISQRGATYPVDYAYNDYGEKISMTTYRSESLSSGDVTTWLRDEATGLVTNKVYADGKGPSYTYTPDGKLATRTWARGVVTAYAYDSSGALTNTVYSDGTPTGSMTYDRIGNLVSAITAGVCTNLYAYDITGLCTNEVQNGVEIARGYDTLGRSTGYTLQASQNSVDISTIKQSNIQTLLSYDALGRIASLSIITNDSSSIQTFQHSNIQTFTYSYLPGTDIVDGYTCGNFSRNIEFEPLRNLVAAVTNSYANRVISAFGYSNDAAGRRTAISRSGEAFGDLSGATDSYGYNSRNEVISARRTNNGKIIHGFNEDFEYDPIGNRIWSTTYNELGEPKTSQYSANNLNQYTSRTVSGYAAVRGHADADATVTVNEKPTYRYGEYFFGSDEFDNSQFALEAELVTSAVLASPTNGPDEVCSVTSRVHIPKATQHFSYDLDGNLSTDGYYTFTYDSNNRLEKVSTNGVLVLANFYDEKSRRVKKVTADAVITFFYDDWNLVEERIVYTNGAMSTIHYCWGTDLSGTLHGAGGVGGLLYLTVDDKIYIPCYDNNGNITQYLDVNGYSVASYAYDSFGGIIMKSGPLADFFRHRFSIKYFDTETCLYYYGYRFYRPDHGRWLNRDPIEEDGGCNLYTFCENNMSFVDYLGQYVNAEYDVANKTLTVNDVDSGASITLKEKVFSGNGKSCCLKDDQWKSREGPLPTGTYLIGLSYDPKNHSSDTGDYNWYRLYGSNGKGGYTYNNIPVRTPTGEIVYRGGFNLHTGRASDGCVTVWSDVSQGDKGYPHSDDYDKLKDFLNKTKPLRYKNSNYTGWLVVK